MNIYAESIEGFYETTKPEDYEDDIKKDPLLIDNYIGLGIYYSVKKKYDESIISFRRALKIPRNKTITFDMETFPSKRRKAIEFNYRIFSYTNYLIARIYYHQNKVIEAIDELKIAISDYPKEYEYHYYLGFILLS